MHKDDFKMRLTAASYWAWIAVLWGRTQALRKRGPALSSLLRGTN